MSILGTMSLGVKLPILKEGNLIIDEILKAVEEASTESNIPVEDSDVFAVTESIVARCHGEYEIVDNIARDIKRLYNNGNKVPHLNIYQPVLSRNRFAIVLKGIARACEKVTVLFSAPTDEVGNEIVPRDWYMFTKYSGELTQEILRKEAEEFTHPFTGVNYVQYYRDLVNSEGCEFEYIISDELLRHITGKNILVCNVHDRELYRALLQEAHVIYTLQDVCNTYNPWGLLGCNKVNEEVVKLFPSNGDTFVETLKSAFKEKFGKDVECMIYGDGGFKCPVCGVWEELDPVISPAFTSGLDRTPSEIKLKYFADNKYGDLEGEKLEEAIQNEINSKKTNLTGNMASQGTTPRRIPDLLGSLSDLTSGSGDKGTPVVWIKNYFKNWAS